MVTQFDVNYYIQKFEAIPEELWCVQVYQDGDKCCALGHCGNRTFIHCTPTKPENSFSEETNKLRSLFYTFLDELVSNVNDGVPFYTGKYEFYNEDTPKKRILKALQLIKEKQNL